MYYKDVERQNYLKEIKNMKSNCCESCSVERCEKRDQSYSERDVFSRNGSWIGISSIHYSESNCCQCCCKCHRRKSYDEYGNPTYPMTFYSDDGTVLEHFDRRYEEDGTIMF